MRETRSSKSLEHPSLRFPNGTRVLVLRAHALPDEPFEEWYVWSVRSKGRLLCLTQYEPDEEDYPTRGKRRIS